MRRQSFMKSGQNPLRGCENVCQCEDVTRQRHVLLSKWKVSWEHWWSQVENAARSDIQHRDLCAFGIIQKPACYQNYLSTCTDNCCESLFETEGWLKEWQNRTETNTRRGECAAQHHLGLEITAQTRFFCVCQQILGDLDRNFMTLVYYYNQYSE